MSVQFIHNTGCGSYGFQARVHVMKGLPRLTRFFAIHAHGGVRAARQAARNAEVQLQRQKARILKAQR